VGAEREEMLSYQGGARFYRGLQGPALKGFKFYFWERVAIKIFDNEKDGVSRGGKKKKHENL